MIIIVQVVLVLVVIFFSLMLVRGGSNAKHMAVRRIMVMLFAISAVLSIFFPTILSQLARLVGVGRGTDLMLYAFIVSFLVYMSTTHQRFRQTETTLTKLSRRIALDEAERPWERIPAAGQAAAGRMWKASQMVGSEESNATVAARPGQG
jgi:small membrane protein